MKPSHYVVEMRLQPISPEDYQALGQAEIDYTKEQIDAGILQQLLVTEDHKQYWMIMAVDNEADLLSVLTGFPLHAYFDYRYYPVLDMVAAARAGVTDPNLRSG